MILTIQTVTYVFAESPSDLQDRTLPEYVYQEVEVEPEIETSSIQVIAMRATHYGESYNGQTLGCSGYGRYDSGDLSIAAVGPASYREWPCGTRLRLHGPAGSIVVVRKDSCPGCNSYGEPAFLDLSEAGHAAVCGVGTCVIAVEALND